ncbi:MAG: ABC transporter substrate-binding protein [Flavobacteriia bacterium]|nr:ABC transporter substrate-binding protein [Flavobacteriia bacterium]
MKNIWVFVSALGVLIFFGVYLFGGLSKVALGNKVYGGVFTYFSSEKQNCYFPLSSNSINEQRVLSKIFEPLLIIDAKNKIIGNLAENFTVSQDYKTIQLKIRSAVYFHADPCFGGSTNKMTVEDVKFSLEFACSASPLNKLSHFLKDKIVGAEAFYKLSRISFPKSGVSGITIIDENTIEIKLTNSYTSFLNILTHPNLTVFSKRAYDYYGVEIVKHAVGTGCFLLGEATENGVSLLRNNNYWKKDEFGKQLPFLDEIKVVYSKNEHEQYIAFGHKKADILFELPLENLDDAFGSLSSAKNGGNLLHKIIYKKGSKINYLAFDCQSFPFNNEKVRRAFSFAIDKKFICDEVLNGDGRPAEFGFVPECNFYTPNKSERVEYNPELAKKLFYESGFTTNNPFPKLDLFVSSAKGSLVDKWCRALVKQLNTILDLELSVVNCNLKEKNNFIASKQAKIWRTGWAADYADADSFLELFCTQNKSENNQTRFYNKEYDRLFLASQITTSQEERNKLQQKIDKLIIKTPIVIPVFSEDIFVVINLRVRDFEFNELGLIDFSKIYLKEIQID